MLDLRSSKHPERRSALLAKEFQRYNLDVIGLSETRILGYTQINEPSLGYSFVLQCRKVGCKRQAGAGFAIKNCARKKFA